MGVHYFLLFIKKIITEKKNFVINLKYDYVCEIIFEKAFFLIFLPIF